MKLLKPKWRGGLRQNRRSYCSRLRCTDAVASISALLLSGCFTPREQLLGSLGADFDAGAEDAATPAPTTSEQQQDGGDVGPTTSAPIDVEAGVPDQAGECVSGILTTSQLRFLTQRQYDRTIRDLLGVEQLSSYDNHAPSWLLAPDTNVAVTQVAWAGYQAAAQAIAAQVMAQPELRSRFIACDLAERESCLSSTVATFGRRAFRRPLTDADLAAFTQLLADGAESPAEEVAQILLETFLISPSFLVRAELNQSQSSPGVFALSSHEVAARLSYLLWGTMPDEQLASTADANGLATSAAALAEAQRMLQDDKARDMVDDFVEHYLRVEPGGYWQQEKDEALFPEYTEAVRDAMALETRLFFQHVVLGGGSFADLVESSAAFVNAYTAPLYGLTASDYGQELVKVELSERPGFLTRVGFLSAYSSFARTSPIRRGAFVTSMLGLTMAPTDSAIATPLPGPELADTIRERVTLQTSESACAACHGVLNQPGFVLEAFDAIGRVQTVERETGARIDTSVEWLVDGETHHVDSVVELMQALARSAQARTEYARRWMYFALELSDVNAENCEVRKMAQALAQDGYTQLDLLADLTQSAQFLSRVQENP